MWLYNDNPIDEETLNEYVAFVYIIINLTNGKRYIGKKLLKSKRTKMVNGKKKKLIVDSDWKKYWGSNKILQQDVKDLGENKFKREILRFCPSENIKGDLFNSSLEKKRDTNSEFSLPTSSFKVSQKKLFSGF